MIGKTLVVCSLLCTASAWADDSRSKIVGDWSRPSLGTALRIAADGTCIVAESRDAFDKAATRCRWTLAGDKLTFTNLAGSCAAPANERVGTYHVRADAATLHFAKIEDRCARRSSIDGETWERVDAKRPADAPSVAMDALDVFLGEWRCESPNEGGPPTVSRAKLERDWGGAWLTVRDDVRDDKSGRIVDGAHGAWGFDLGARTYVRMFHYPRGAWDTATSAGWKGDKLVWSGDYHDTHKQQRFRHTFVKKGDRQIDSVFELEDGGGWHAVGTESCKK